MRSPKSFVISPQSGDPAVVTEVSPYVNETRGMLAGYPVSLSASLQLDCANGVEYEFSHWTG